jgi:hypothetical protein
LVVKCAPLGASTTVSTIIRLISSCCGTTDFTSSVGTTFSTDSSASRRHQEQVVEVRIDPGVGGVAALIAEVHVHQRRIEIQRRHGDQFLLAIFGA